MDDTSFGITMTVIGMGGTFITLGVIVVSIHLLKKIFPIPDEHGLGHSTRTEGHSK
ncbi:MAG TPA: OadG family protein [Desulfomonilaceae bacterium]|nr:OadG family protein [Desulfomonilaceae bacterium]